MCMPGCPVCRDPTHREPGCRFIGLTFPLKFKKRTGLPVTIASSRNASLEQKKRLDSETLCLIESLVDNYPRLEFSEAASKQERMLYLVTVVGGSCCYNAGVDLQLMPSD